MSTEVAAVRGWDVLRFMATALEGAAKAAPEEAQAVPATEERRRQLALLIGESMQIRTEAGELNPVWMVLPMLAKDISMLMSLTDTDMGHVWTMAGFAAKCAADMRELADQAEAETLAAQAQSAGLIN